MTTKKTVPVMWTNKIIIVGTYDDTHVRLISENKLDLDKKEWGIGRALDDVLYYYGISKLDNPILKKIFKKFILQQEF